MRKIVEYCLVSADGIVLDDPFPSRDYYDEPYLQDSLALFNECDAMLFGRTTYNRFAKIYGGGGGNPAYAGRLNAIRNTFFHHSWRRPSGITRPSCVATLRRRLPS
jgi:hypothetical protein